MPEAARLLRETFKTSRLLEFCSPKELVAQTGHDVDDWPVYIAKEMIDNGIDIAEEHGVAPEITVSISTERGEIVIADNGPGIAAETVDSIIDYTTRTSSRAGYVSPSRGQQGNALQSIIPMGFVLAPDIGETVIIEAHEIAHRIRFSVDPIRQEPRISCERGVSTVRNGTRVTVRIPCHLIEDARHRFLPLVWDFVGLNPHLTIAGELDGAELVDCTPTDPDWQKWRPSDAIPPTWYTPDSLQRQIAASVHRDQERGNQVRSVRDFLGGFAGLSSTAKRSAVLGETGLFRARLDVFFDGDRVDRHAIARLLSAMQASGRTVKPKALGVIGEDHFRWLFAADNVDPARFKYARIAGEAGGLPFVVETAFAPTPEMSSTPLVSGVNWSPAINDPFGSLLSAIRYEQHIDFRAPVLLGVHVATPSVFFVDRGKSSVVLSPAARGAVNDAVRKVTKEWAAAFEKRERETYRQRRAVAMWEEAEEKKDRPARRDNSVVGIGALHRQLAAAANGGDIEGLLVLSKSSDPYAVDTVAGHAEGLWFRSMVERFVGDGRVHLRGLFYMIVAAGDVRRPFVGSKAAYPVSGAVVVNSYSDWVWFLRTSLAARWLAYVPFERIIDARNEQPRRTVIAEAARAGLGSLIAGANLELPEFECMLPVLDVVSPHTPQPHRIIFVCEKSSVADVLEPLADKIDAELVPVTGESSVTRIAEVILRAAGDARRMVVLYFADFDPAGYQMPTSVARKIQALVVLRSPEQKVTLHRVALTLDQVRQLNLPSTPLKPSEKRSSKWRERMEREQTEIDALAALHPGALDRMAREALKPYVDFDLQQRCTIAVDKWRAKAQKKLDRHPAWPEIKADMEPAYQKVTTALRDLERAKQSALERLQGDKHGITSEVIAAPKAKTTGKPPATLFSTDDDFVTATRKLIADKGLVDDDDEEE